MALLDSLFRKKSIQQTLATFDKENESEVSLDKNLNVRDLTALGIAAIIGAGIFSTIGSASFNGGPAVVFLFIFTAVACGFAALAYAEFASLLPISGSAYTYSYVAFGELVAWIIGWALIMEYAVGNITVAVSWSGYFTRLAASSGWAIPAWATIDYPSAKALFLEVSGLMQSGAAAPQLTEYQQEGYSAWQSAPMFGGLRVILDLPAIIMSVLITALVYIGMKESKNVGNWMVLLKLAVVALVIIVGVGYVDTTNWTPFAPNGFSGVMAGVSSVFFAYIGFDALSTTAEECKDPQRDLPRSMIYSIIICTILYILIALVLTGMVNYKELDVDDPLAFVFDKLNLKWFSGIIAVSAVVAMAGVFLVFQLGQPRIWMAMSRDGLLPKRFSKIHPRFRTPSYSTIVTGLFVIVPMLFIPSDVVLDLCSMGTLFAFVLVCAGVLKLQITPDAPRGKFRIPYINGKLLFPALLVGIVGYLLATDPASVQNWLANAPEAAEDGSMVGGWALFQHKIPMWLFILTCTALSFWAFKHDLSLFPMLGLAGCLYMMAQIPAHSWFGFFIWLAAGLVIYFGYGYRNSKLAKA